MSNYRLDKSNLAQAARRTQDGYIEDRPIVTRTGVFPYRNADGGIRWELRHPDDVYAADSLATLSMLPITNGHPDEFVNADTAKQLSIGFTGEHATIDGANVRTAVRITDANGVKDIEAGRRELSLGYKIDLAEESGTYNGVLYTHRQKNIRYNHLSIVDRARMGASARINLDAAEQIEHDAPRENPRNDNGDNTTMSQVKVNLDGLTYDAAPEVAKALEKARADNAELTTKAKTETARADKAEAERDAANEKVKALESKDHAGDIAKAAKARIDLERSAGKVLPKETADKLDGMTDAEIRLAVIKAASPEINLDGKSADYIAARFDAAIDTLSGNADALARQRQTGLPRQEPGGNGGNMDADDLARDKMLKGLDYRTRDKK